MLRLTKHHGLGNDFLVLLDERQDRPVPPALLPGLARDLCDRHRGVGADGLLHGAAGDGGIDVVMVLHNADGSRAEMSGNGIRCLAQAVAGARGIEAGELRIATDAGLRPVVVSPGAGPAEVVVAVGMGKALPGPEVPSSVAARLAGRRHATVDVGNPHLVVEVDDPWSVDLATEGPALETAFPEGVNVEFVAAAGDGLDLTVWERGAGITQACGTGATAASVVAQGWGLVADPTAVRMPGGRAEVRVAADGATLIGPSVTIAELVVPSPPGSGTDGGPPWPGGAGAEGRA